MKKKTFQYGGFTFEPAGQFSDYGIKPGKNEFKQICSALYYTNRDGVADGDEDYDYAGFYLAATDKNADVFLCLDNKVLYVPCQGVLAEFNQQDDASEITLSYYRRRREHEQRERDEKKAALREASYFTYTQSEAVKKAIAALEECRDLGIDFAVQDDTLYAFRRDTLTDLTENMVARKGQASLDLIYQVAPEIWNAADGLYANVKSETK